MSELMEFDAMMCAVRAALDGFEAGYRNGMQEGPEDHPAELGLMDWTSKSAHFLLYLRPDRIKVTPYTVFALDPSGEQMGDALLVVRHHLDAAIQALRHNIDEEEEGLHFEVHQDSVRDSNGWKPLPWLPGQAVTDPETEAAPGREIW